MAAPGSRVPATSRAWGREPDSVNANTSARGRTWSSNSPGSVSLWVPAAGHFWSSAQQESRVATDRFQDSADVARRPVLSARKESPCAGDRFPAALYIACECERFVLHLANDNARLPSPRVPPPGPLKPCYMTDRGRPSQRCQPRRRVAAGAAQSSSVQNTKSKSNTAWRCIACASNPLES